jgi:hypothetical protein
MIRSKETMNHLLSGFLKEPMKIIKQAFREKTEYQAMKFINELIDSHKEKMRKKQRLSRLNKFLPLKPKTNENQ